MSRNQPPRLSPNRRTYEAPHMSFGPDVAYGRVACADAPSILAATALWNRDMAQRARQRGLPLDEIRHRLNAAECETVCAEMLAGDMLAGEMRRAA